MQDLGVQALTAVLSILVAGVGVLISAFVPKIKDAVDEHLGTAQANIANKVIDGLGSIAQTVVADFNQRVVADAKAKGIFTAELAASVKEDAVKAVIAQAPELIELGKSAIGDVEALIPQLIEQAVLKAK
ncbi:hypothetical protein [Sporolactobacillus terrae]|uniref:hypothetical protein n=1 Tax=Sporolactobacillus terrae TaxID=269673 RepID=UPI000A9E8411|nr:hypothetical protein [Sporolactobacillus terrae]